MQLQYQKITHTQGEKCPSCMSLDSIKDKGVLTTKDGKYGIFLSCSKYPECKYAIKATKSDKRKHLGKKTRRGKKKKTALDPVRLKKKEEAMKVQNQMKKERAQQFRDFERLIEKE